MCCLCLGESHEVAGVVTMEFNAPARIEGSLGVRGFSRERVGQGEG